MLQRIVKGLQLFPCHVKLVNRLQVNRLPRQSTCSQEFKKDYKQSHERECIHESNCKKSAAILLILYFLQRKTCCFKGNKRIRKLWILLPFLQQQTDCSLYQWIMIRQARTKHLLTLCNLQLTWRCSTPHITEKRHDCKTLASQAVEVDVWFSFFFCLRIK